MLVIRESQWNAFRRQADEALAKQLEPHFQRHHGAHCRWLGPQDLRLALVSGVQRARQRGFESPRDACLYINLQFMLGSHFDDDQQLPWAVELTTSNDPAPARIDRLYDAAMSYLDRIAGPDNQALVKALLRVQAYAPRDVLSFAEDAFPDHMAALLGALYPEKAHELGTHGMHALVLRGRERAQAHGMADRLGVAVCAGLIFMLGTGFDDDPLHPWAKRILAAADDGRPQRLHEQAISFLRQVGLAADADEGAADVHSL
jgi:hypothetical protein